MRKGHKVKHVLSIGPSYHPLLLDCCSFVSLSFLVGFLIPTFSAFCGQGRVCPPETPLSALMHSGQSNMPFQVCRRLHCQQMIIKYSLVLKDDLDTWLHQKKTGKVSVCNVIADKSSYCRRPPYKKLYWLHTAVQQSITTIWSAA